MLCVSRVARINNTERFADGKHVFYLEYRCNRPCIENNKYCKHCSRKDPAAPHQFFMSFEHGDVNQPITEKSHIFGGKWYIEAVKKYGAPPPEIIEFALQFQQEARKGFDTIITMPSQIDDEIHKEDLQSTAKEMPRAKKEETAVSDQVKPKRTRKPKVAPPNESATDKVETESQIKPVKRTRKPKAVNTETVTAITKEETTIKPKKVTSPVEPQPLILPNQMKHQEVVLPTYMETTIEEINTDDYEIEYVTLSIFEVGQATYLRDCLKNKLYKKIKDKGVGAYIGRWNPDTESIITDIPDSDDEN